MGQLGYRKSKNGCLLCKQRRVKCDEKQPCTACERHQVRCSLVETSSDANVCKKTVRRPSPRLRKLPLTKAARGTAGANTPSSDSATAKSTSFTLSPQPRSAFDAHDTTISTDSWITDLELMHHYTTATWSTFPIPHHTDHVLRDDIPRLALRFPYLMHELLAVTSLHVAYLSRETSKRYLTSASSHQSFAISGMRVELSEAITEESSRALFTTSAFLMVGSFAGNLGLEQPACESHCPMGGILEVFSVLRGMGAIRKVTSKQLQRDLIRDIFGAQPLDLSCESLSLVQSQLRLLEDRIATDYSLGKGTKLALCSGMASLLGFMDGKSTSTVMTSRELGVVFGWPRVISDELLGLLHARHPAALTLLLYYCIIMQNLEADYWFLNGWSSRLGRAVWTSLCGSPWEEAAQWPLQQLGIYGG